MNRVQRRLWKAFLTAGGDVEEPQQLERFQRLVHDHIHLMPPALLRVMVLVLDSDSEVDYEQLARDLASKDRLHVSRSALRQRVSRALRRLETVIEQVHWKSGPRTAIVFQRPSHDRYRGPSAPNRTLPPLRLPSTARDDDENP